MDLEAGNVYTAWWVLANNPEVCEASPCSGADFVGKAAEAQTEVAYADGVIVGESGVAHFAAYLPVGEVTDDPWFGNGFTNPRNRNAFPTTEPDVARRCGRAT
jgi:hypothetical protein